MKINLLLASGIALLTLTTLSNSSTKDSKKEIERPMLNYANPSNFLSEFSNSITSPDMTLLNNERISYFYNLNDYSPENYCGSCGYVSLVQYLCYYDSFYNDSIIPENYERNQGSASSLTQARAISPGVLRQTYPNTLSGFYSFVQNNRNADYQLQLMYTVNEAYGHNENSYSPLIGMWEYYLVINSINAFSSTSFYHRDVSYYGANAIPTDQNVISGFDAYVKSELDDGNPVLLHIAQYNSVTGEYDNYHSIVAYYYDNNGIHANFGSGSGSTDVIIPSNYQITNAGVIDFDDVLETHSDNFIVNYARYCGCGLHTVHNYCDHYSTFSSTQHVAYCTCSNYILEAHVADLASSYLFQGHLYAQCMYCGTTIDLGGDGPIIPIPFSNSQYVSDNGSYIMTNGIYVIVEEDLESFLNGTLIFHPLGDISI